MTGRETIGTATGDRRVLGRGAQAEVLAWGEGLALKLFWEGAGPGGVRHEALLASLIHEAGMPSPAVNGVVEVDGRAGIIYERVDGPTMAGELLAAPWRAATLARLLAELHAEVHGLRVTRLPSQRERLRNNVERAAPLSNRLRRAALAAIERLPDGDAVCHGDFHPGNIILRSGGHGKGSAVIIDWPDASAGRPSADVARTLLLGRMAARHAPNGAAAVGTALLASVVTAVYLRRYTQLRPLSRREVSAWMMPLAAARLAEKITEEEPALIALVEREVDRGSW